MSLFGNQDGQLKALTEEITKLSKTVAQLRAQREALTEVDKLETTITSLKKQVSQLEIDKAKKQEEFDRQERELTHKVGLEKKRQEMELAATKREVAVQAREEALQAQKDQFKAQMEFREQQFQAQISQFGKQFERLEQLTEKMVERLPTVTIQGRRNFDKATE